MCFFHDVPIDEFVCLLCSHVRFLFLFLFFHDVPIDEFVDLLTFSVSDDAV